MGSAQGAPQNCLITGFASWLSGNDAPSSQATCWEKGIGVEHAFQGSEEWGERNPICCFNLRPLRPVIRVSHHFRPALLLSLSVRVSRVHASLPSRTGASWHIDVHGLGIFHQRNTFLPTSLNSGSDVRSLPQRLSNQFNEDLPRKLFGIF